MPLLDRRGFYRFKTALRDVGREKLDDVLRGVESFQTVHAERTRDGAFYAAYDSSRTSTVPADLTEALNAEPEAAAFFATLNAANRYSHLYAVQTAKKPETRTAKIVSMCLSHEKPHP